MNATITIHFNDNESAKEFYDAFLAARRSRSKSPKILSKLKEIKATSMNYSADENSTGLIGYGTTLVN